MAGFVVVVLIISCLVGYLVWVSSAPDSAAHSFHEQPPTEAELLQARLDLHRIERGVDIALAKQEQRREAERVKQAIAEALRDDRP